MSYSQSSTGVILQYYNFTRFGRRGYERVVRQAIASARWLSVVLELTGWFFCLSDVHRQLNNASPESTIGLPVVSFHLKPEVLSRLPLLNEERLSEKLRAKGYSVPCEFKQQT